MHLPPKNRVRRIVRDRIADMSISARRDADRAISRHLLGLALELGSRTVLGYVAMTDEVRVDEFLAGAVERGLGVLLPWSLDDGILLRPWRPSGGMARDRKGVLAPVGIGPGRALGAGALLVVPGRAFDETGTRVGRGGGYYDRLLSLEGGAGRTTVGAAYRCQMFPVVPREAHDVPMDLVVTEDGARPALRA